MTHHSDTDALDDLRFLAGNALNMAEKYQAEDGSNPIRDGLQERVKRLDGYLKKAYGPTDKEAPVVTREHRGQTLAAFFPGGYGMQEWALRFLTTGEIDVAHAEFADVAKAIAAAAQRGASRSGTEVERLKAEQARHAEICSGWEERAPDELERLNPYKHQHIVHEVPQQQPASFIHGVRYYLGMLEDGDNWSHSLGHIEELCREFQAAIDARVGRQAAQTVTLNDSREGSVILFSEVVGDELDQQTLADLEAVRKALPLSIFADEDHINEPRRALDRIEKRLRGAT